MTLAALQLNMFESRQGLNDLWPSPRKCPPSKLGSVPGWLFRGQTAEAAVRRERYVRCSSTQCRRSSIQKIVMPHLERKAVSHLCQEFEVSQRRACQVVGAKLGPSCGIAARGWTMQRCVCPAMPQTIGLGRHAPISNKGRYISGETRGKEPSKRGL